MHNTTAYPHVVALPCPPPCRMAHSIEMQMSLAQLPPTATPRISITKWELSFTSCFCSLVAFVSFFRVFFFFHLFLFLLLSSFVSCVAFVALIFLAHIIKVASQVASLPLVARNFLLAISCISFSHLGNFSNPLFACGFLWQTFLSFFLPIPICCYENFTKFSLTLALILSATLSVAGRIVLDPKSTTTHTHFGVFCPIFPDIYQA